MPTSADTLCVSSRAHRVHVRRSRAARGERRRGRFTDRELRGKDGIAADQRDVVDPGNVEADLVQQRGDARVDHGRSLARRVSTA